MFFIARFVFSFLQMKFCEQVVTSVYLYVYRFNHLMSNDETILNGAHGARFKIYIIKIYIYFRL